MQYDSELGEYELHEIRCRPNEFVWCIKKEYENAYVCNFKDIYAWWNNSGFGKNNWMVLNSERAPHMAHKYFIFELTFVNDEDAMAFKLRWL